jgi:hypothetical protein
LPQGALLRVRATPGVSSLGLPNRTIYDDVVADHGRQRAFICLAAFLIAFFLIRTSARMTRRFTWARWFYRADSRRLGRARERYDDPGRWTKRARRRLENAVGGRPSGP